MEEAYTEQSEGHIKLSKPLQIAGEWNTKDEINAPNAMVNEKEQNNCTKQLWLINLLPIHVLNRSRILRKLGRRERKGKTRGEKVKVKAEWRSRSISQDESERPWETGG